MDKVLLCERRPCSGGDFSIVPQRMETHTPDSKTARLALNRPSATEQDSNWEQRFRLHAVHSADTRVRRLSTDSSA